MKVETKEGITTLTLNVDELELIQEALFALAEMTSQGPMSTHEAACMMRGVIHEEVRQ